jgi:magnesium chelatase family protein
MDLRLVVETPRRSDLASDAAEEKSEAIRSRIMEARKRTLERLREYGLTLNSQVPSNLLRSPLKAEKSAMSHLHSLIDKEAITARGFHKVLRVAWSISDLRDYERPGLEEVEIALALRAGLRA